MGTDIINTIESLHTRNFSDYKFLVTDLRNIISKFDSENAANLIKDRNLDGYFFKINSIDFIKKVFNEKLEEFITNFFFEDELIRMELIQDPNILEDIYNIRFVYFFRIASQTIESFEYGPSKALQMETLLKFFEQKYNSGYYTSPKQNTISPKKEGCFIATFAYNSYEHPNVITLRKFRDEILINSSYGKLFIKKYYKYSPSLVLYLEKIKFPKSPIKLIIKGMILIIPKKKSATNGLS